MNISIIGAGAWGTAVAIHAAKLAQANPQLNLGVSLWARDAVQARNMHDSRKNERYLPGIEFPANLVIEAHWDTVIQSASHDEDLLIIATPLAGLASTCGALLKNSNVPKNWIWLCKGIEPDSCALPHEIVERELNAYALKSRIQFGVLSGPSFALEVAKGLPCALTVASRFPALCDLTQKFLHHGAMRVYATADVGGVELGGAVKNILAIATGIGDGMNLGLNARAAIITRGMVEMARLGQAMGARPETFSGLAGLGDLILTATGDLSRNRQVGLALAQGKTLDQILKDLGHVAEGVRCAQAVRALAHRCQVQMPIVEAVCQVLFSDVAPAQALMQLMARDARSEKED